MIVVLVVYVIVLCIIRLDCVRTPVRCVNLNCASSSTLAIVKLRYCIESRLKNEILEDSKIGSSQTRHGIPTFSCIETLGTAPWIISSSNII